MSKTTRTNVFLRIKDKIEDNTKNLVYRGVKYSRHKRNAHSKSGHAELCDVFYGSFKCYREMITGKNHIIKKYLCQPPIYERGFCRECDGGEDLSPFISEAQPEDVTVCSPQLCIYMGNIFGKVVVKEVKIRNCLSKKEYDAIYSPYFNFFSKELSRYSIPLRIPDVEDGEYDVMICFNNKGGKKFRIFKNSVFRFLKDKKINSRIGKKRKLEETSEIENFKLLHVDPPNGSIKGGDHVDIYCYFPVVDYFERLRESVKILLKFGGVYARYGKACIYDRDYYGYEDIQKKGLGEKCQNANFVIPAKTPSHDKGFVCVDLETSAKKIGSLPQGFEYMDESEFLDFVDALKIPPILEEFDPFYQFPFDKDDGVTYSDKNNTVSFFGDGDNNVSIGNIDSLFLECCTDLFGANCLFYFIAQNKLDRVKFLVEKRNFSLDFKDTMGYKPIDIAKYFKNEEMVKYLENMGVSGMRKKKVVEIEETLKVIDPSENLNEREDLKKLCCRYCKEKVFVSGNQKITHFCKGSSKNSKMKDFDFKNIEVRYIDDEDEYVNVDFGPMKMDYRELFDTNGKLSEKLKIPVWETAYLFGRKRIILGTDEN